MKKLLSLFYTLVLLAGLSTVAKAADPIRIPVLNWSSQIVMANVMKLKLLKSLVMMQN